MMLSIPKGSTAYQRKKSIGIDATKFITTPENKKTKKYNANCRQTAIYHKPQRAQNNVS